MEPAVYLLLIGELNGCYQQLKKLNQPADLEVIQQMIVKYNKLYFKTKKAHVQNESECNRS
tara:strand:+ start:378 stop:560 length:183 start_codon:yes stop_codon:yes gene_type:complete